MRLPAHLEGLDGLIIPGGESTTIGKLAVDYGLMEPLRALWPPARHLGHLRRGHLSFQRYPPPPAAAGLDGYRSRSATLLAARWTALRLTCTSRPWPARTARTRPSMPSLSAPR